MYIISHSTTNLRIKYVLCVLSPVHIVQFWPVPDERLWQFLCSS